MGTEPKHFKLLLDGQWLKSSFKLDRFKIGDGAIIEIKDKDLEKSASNFVKISTHTRKKKGVSYGYSYHSSFARVSVSSLGSSSSSSSSSSASSPDFD